MDSPGNQSESDDLPKYSLSHYFSSITTICFTLLILATMGLLLFSNLHSAEYVNVYIKPTQGNTHHFAPIKHNTSFSSSTFITNYLRNDITSIYNFQPELKDEYSIKVFTITIASSIRDFWNSKAYELAIVIAAASLIWPYIKLLILLCVWLCDLHQNIRTKLILFIDQAGKWSYMDLYASVVMTVCFYVHSSFTFKDIDIDIRIVCEPDTGIVAFVIANLLSMAYSHIFIFWDQKYGYQHHVEIWEEQIQSKAALILNEDINASEKPVYKVSGVYDSFYRAEIHIWRNDEDYHIFAMLYRPQSMLEVFCFSFYLMSLLALLCLIIQTVFTVPAIFDIEGIVGMVIGSPANIREYNPIQTANALITSTDKYDSALFLCICYWITIIICPILTQIVLILIWFAPMKHKYFVFLLKSIWFVQAWNALDVFFIGTMSGSIEMNTVSQWIIDSTYPGLCGDNGALSNELGMGCFNVVGHITRGCWMAGVAAICQWYAIWFSLRTAKDIGIHGMEY